MVDTPSKDLTANPLTQPPAAAPAEDAVVDAPAPVAGEAVVASVEGNPADSSDAANASAADASNNTVTV